MTKSTVPKPFAQGTKVDPFKTLGDIDKILTKAGASSFDTFRRSAREGVAFVRDGVAYRVSVYVPQTDEEAKPFVSRLGGHGSPQDAERARRLRSLLSVVRAKVVSVQDDVYAFEEAFGTDIITDSGETLGERAARTVRSAITDGRALSALPMPGEWH